MEMKSRVEIILLRFPITRKGAFFLRCSHFNFKSTGLLGKHFQRLVASGRSQPFLCRYVEEERVGSKMKNGSFSNSIGLLEKGAIHEQTAGNFDNLYSEQNNHF